MNGTEVYFEAAMSITDLKLSTRTFFKQLFLRFSDLFLS